MTSIDRRRDHTSTRGRAGLLSTIAALALLLAACLPPASQLPPPGLHQAPPAPLARVGHGLAAVPGPLPFPIEANVGQAGPDAAFLMRAGDLTVGFGAGRLTYALQADERDESGDRDPSTMPGALSAPAARTWTVRQELVGARQALPVGTVAAATAVSYFVGPSDAWKLGVPAYHQVAYAEPWTGIMATYERAGAGLKSTYHLEPGANPDAIRLAYRGGDVSVAEDGALEIATPLGLLRESAPVAWQERGGQRTAVSAAWEIVSEPGADDAEVGFRLGAYDRSLGLVIDPSLLYASYLGGSGDDAGSDIAVDGSGAAYVTGGTRSTQSTFPDGDPNLNGQIDAPGFDRTFNGDTDAFVAKLTPDGRGLVYLTYLGGNASDTGSGIAVDGSGAAYVTGDALSTESTFPTGGGFVPGFDQAHNGSVDAFVVKLTPDGQGLLYATYLGGSNSESGRAIAVNAGGAAYVAGTTTSTQTTFPDGDPNADDQMNIAGSDQTHNGQLDAFVVKLTPDGRNLDYATYAGGNSTDIGIDIALDGAGAAYITGQTFSESTTFPDGNGFGAVPGFDRSHNSGSDGFAIKLAPDGRSFAYATYIGGIVGDIGFGIAVDGTGAAYVTGDAGSSETSFPNGTGLAALVVPGFDQTANQPQFGATDAFVVKLAPNGESLLYATYLGGSEADGGASIAVDASGAAYVAGFAASTQATFPNGTGLAALGVPGFDQSFNGGDSDVFVVKLAPNGQSLSYATFLGGSGGDFSPVALAIDGNGTAYVAARTLSTQATFPDGDGFGGANAAPGFNQAHQGRDDAYVAKIGALPTSTPLPTATPAPTSTPVPPPTSVPTPPPGPAPSACSPRPNVLVTAVPQGNGLLAVGLRAQSLPATPNNALRSLRVVGLNNAQVRLNGNPIQAGQEITLPAGAPDIALVLQRSAAGQPATAQIVVTDACGEWPTLVGGGPNAF